MHNAVMGSLDGDLEKVAFDVAGVKRILDRSGANIVHSQAGELYLELAGDVYPVITGPQRDVKPFVIVLDSSEAFNVADYRMLFEVQPLPNDLIMGKDIQGQVHLCRWHGTPGSTSEHIQEQPHDLCLEEIEKRLDAGELSAEELEEIKNMVKNLRNGHFFEELTSEFSSKIKEIALELIDFRKDIKKRIEPGIVEIAAKDIPEASNQLEGINTTLEKSTMKIMDINEEQMELANRELEKLLAWLDGHGGKASPEPWEQGVEIIQEMEQLVPGLPEEARQVMQFVMSGVETGRELLCDRGDALAIQEALAEPMSTIDELMQDLGDTDQGIQRLSELNTAMRGIVEACRQGEESVPGGNGGSADLPEPFVRILKDQAETLRTIGKLSMSMMEPLSFQDLVGQRIQRIIKLVKTMELRIEDLIISFGIKMQKHKEDPTRSFEELAREVEHFKSELKGPQTEGEGLDQEGIDDLLAGL